MPIQPLQHMALRATAFAASLFPLGTWAVPVQLTSGAGFNSFGASVSDDGNRVAFYSATNLTDGNQEIFVYDVLQNLFTQVTDTSGPGVFNIEAAISGDGRSLAYTSSADLTGNNPNLVPQIFLQDLAPGQSVPEPSTLLLLAAGGLAAAACRRQRIMAASIA